jgi:hypothetical protein
LFHCKNYKADLESGLYENIRISAKLPPRIRKTFTPQSIGHRQVLAVEIFLKGNQQAVAQQASMFSFQGLELEPIGTKRVCSSRIYEFILLFGNAVETKTET